MSSVHSSHQKLKWRRTLVETYEEDGEIDGADYEDVRCEMQATGYHLVRKSCVVQINYNVIEYITSNQLSIVDISLNESSRNTAG